MLEISKNRIFRSLPYSIVDLAIDEKWVSELSYFLHITSLKGNGIIYNYSCRTLAEKLGVSKSTISRNVKFLLNKGLLFICDKGHLKGLSVKELRLWYTENTEKETGKGLLRIKLHNNLKYTKYNIYSRIPLKNIGNQRFMADRRAEVHVIRERINSGKYISKKELDTFRKLESSFINKNTENAKSNSSKTVNFLSDGFISKKSGLSISTVRVMMEFWVDQGLLTSSIIKGGCIRSRTSPREYYNLKKERPLEFSNSYLYKGLVLTYNKRVVGYGTSIGHGTRNPNSILGLIGQ